MKKKLAFVLSAVVCGLLLGALIVAVALLPLESKLKAQTDYLNVVCGSGAAGVNYLLMTGQVKYPLCLAIGATLKITTVNGHATLNAVSPPAAVPRQMSEKIPIDPATPASTITLNFTLSKTPVPGGQVLIFMRSSALGGDTMDAQVTPAVNPKDIVFTLPTYRPFTTDDSIVVVYFTLE